MTSAARLSVVYADDQLIAADKPAGVHTAPLGKDRSGTLLELVIQEFPEVAAVPGIKPVEPGLLHRLDRDTSGLVIVARTAEAFVRMRRDFAAGRAAKEYIAVCRRGAGARPPLDITSRFAPYGPGRRKVRVVPAARGGARAKAAGREYRTELEVLAEHGGLLLVRARITRGFRHQVRAHLAHIGLPILGDPLYGVGAPGPAAPAPRMLLHASAIELPHPADGRRLRIASPLPPGFADLFPRLGSPDLAPRQGMG